MRGVLVTLVVAAGVLATPSLGLGEGGGGPLGIRRAKVRLHRERGTTRDRLKLQASFPMLGEPFDAGAEGIEFLVAGEEVLCVPPIGPQDPRDPGDPDPEPLPPPPPPPPPPVNPSYLPPPPPGVAGPPRRIWSVTEHDDASWTWRSRGIRVDLDLVGGTFTVSGKGLNLDALADAGPGAVDIALVLGQAPFGTVVGLEERGRVWSYADR